MVARPFSPSFMLRLPLLTCLWALAGCGAAPPPAPAVDPGTPATPSPPVVSSPPVPSLPPVPAKQGEVPKQSPPIETGEAKDGVEEKEATATLTVSLPASYQALKWQEVDLEPHKIPAVIKIPAGATATADSSYEGVQISGGVSSDFRMRITIGMNDFGNSPSLPRVNSLSTIKFLKSTMSKTVRYVHTNHRSAVPAALVIEIAQLEAGQPTERTYRCFVNVASEDFDYAVFNDDGTPLGSMDEAQLAIHIAQSIRTKKSQPPLTPQQEFERRKAKVELDDNGNIMSLGGFAKVSDAAMIHVASLKDLERLDPSWRRMLGDKGAVHLAELTKLQRLSLDDTRVTDAGLANIRGLTAMTWLDLRRTQITGEGMDALKELVNLEVLFLGGTKVRLKDLEKAGSAKIVRVEAPGTPTTDEDLAVLSRWKDLESLDLSGTNVTGPGLAHLSQVPKLRVLRLGGLPIEDASLKVLGKTPSLEDLSLYKARVSGAFLAHLKGHEHIRRLAFEDCPLADEHLSHLAGFKSVEILSFYKSKISGESLKHLSGLENLARLNLRQTQITDAHLQALAPLASLELLDLTVDGKHLTQEAVKKLAESLPDCKIRKYDD